MITPVDERLRDEVRRYRLRFTCEACHAFDEEAQLCVYGYPTEEHRNVAIDRRAAITFCKAFELA